MKPLRNPKHLAWVRSFPCIVPGCRSRHSEAAHIGGHGMSVKAPDDWTLPICARHHRTDNDSLHKLGRRRFEQLHNLNLFELVAMFRERPRVWLNGDVWIASYAGEHRVLCSVKSGLVEATRRAGVFRDEILRERFLRREREVA